jgi:hypothetical protein
LSMSRTYAEPLDRLDAGLDELAAIGPEFRTTDERREFLLRVARIKARAAAQEMRVLTDHGCHGGPADDGAGRG